MKFKYLSFLIILSLSLSACINGTKSKEYLGEIYSVALDSILEQGGGFNSYEYIAIDIGNFIELDESDKQEIVSYFKEKYKVDTMVATLEELKEKGLVNPDTNSIDGVLLSIVKVDFKFNNNVYIEGSRYVSGKGAAGVEVTVHYKDNNWRAKKVKLIWES